MKTYIYILFSSLGLCYLAFYFHPYIYIKANSAQVKELASISHSIRTIDPVDTNYQDLAFLKDKLKGIDLVMLGEQDHGDGATFLAKSRLIQFLHQEMNFDVLLFESSIYDCFNLWEDMSGTPVRMPGDFNQALFFFWGSSNETKDLRTYIMQHARSAHPLILGGFDLQFSGEINESARAYLMRSYLDKKNIVFQKGYRYFLNIIENYQHVTKEATAKAMSEVYKNAVLEELNGLITQLEESLKSDEDKIVIRYLLGIKTELHYQWMYPGNEEKQLIARDSMMAENIIWLKEHFYKNKKIMVWAANSHIFYNTHLMNTPTEWNYKRTGEYLKNRYDSDCYSINFTSYGGRTYDRFQGKCKYKSEFINKSVGYGIEAALHATGDSLLFIDGRSIPKKSFLRGKTTMKLLGHGNISAYWSKITDGIFFIDQMKPASFD